MHKGCLQSSPCAFHVAEGVFCEDVDCVSGTKIRDNWHGAMAFSNQESNFVFSKIEKNYPHPYEKWLMKLHVIQGRCTFTIATHTHDIVAPTAPASWVRLVVICVRAVYRLSGFKAGVTGWINAT